MTGTPTEAGHPDTDAADTPPASHTAEPHEPSASLSFIQLLADRHGIQRNESATQRREVNKPARK